MGATGISKFLYIFKLFLKKHALNFGFDLSEYLPFDDPKEFNLTRILLLANLLVLLGIFVYGLIYFNKLEEYYDKKIQIMV